ncbi:MAG: hypothetical protein PHW04_12140 [Candidatus Wallbacteria bacterium]|nr:hypothetical protein [Candidatus Wallbacteria bacterium]
MTELYYNLAYLLSATLTGFLFLRRLSSCASQDEFNRLNGSGDNLAFASGVILFLCALPVRISVLQTVMILMAAGPLFFIFYSRPFVMMAQKAFQKIDSRSQLVFVALQILLVATVEHTRGIY